MDEVYQRAGVNNILNSGRRMVRADHNAKEVLIPKTSVTDLGGHTRSVDYKTSTVTYEFKSKTLNYDQDIRLFVDIMDIEEAEPSYSAHRSHPRLTPPTSWRACARSRASWTRQMTTGSRISSCKYTGLGGVPTIPSALGIPNHVEPSNSSQNGYARLIPSISGRPRLLLGLTLAGVAHTARKADKRHRLSTMR